MKRYSTPEPLETRIALTTTAIIKALGLPAGSTLNDYSNPNAIGVGSNFGSEGLLGFPTGSDDQFVVLSTGDATRITTPAGYSKDGTDWLTKGEQGDDVNLFMSVPVPAGATRFKLDFMVLTAEEPGPTNLFNDHFTVTVDAGAGQQNLIDAGINDGGFVAGASTAGTIFTHRSFLETMNVQVPPGASSISVSMTLSDVHDGKGDTAVILDNARFEQSANVVYLNFNGGTARLGPGIALTIPAFQPSDLGSSATRSDLINEVVTDIEAKYAPFDISFVTTKPSSGDFTTVIIGGSQNAPVTLNNDPMNGELANPYLVNKFGTSTGYKTLQGYPIDSTLFGEYLDGFVDVGNKNRHDTVAVFPQSFPGYFFGESPATLEDRMVVTMAHELGHALGLRHVENLDSNSGNIMKARESHDPTAIFEDKLLNLSADVISPIDGITQQNDAAYLRSILGSATGSDVELGFSPLAYSKYITARFRDAFGAGGLYNVYLGVIPGQPANSDQSLTQILPDLQHFDHLTGDEVLQLPFRSFDDKFVFYGQSTPNGNFDVFSGTAVSGNIDPANMGVPLFNPDHSLNTSIPTSAGSFGSLAVGPDLGLKANPFKLNTLRAGTYTDADGDQFTINLSGKGTLAFTMNDPDGDGHGSIDTIFLQDTTSKDKLTVTVKPPKSGGSDGLVSIGAINGATLGGIDAKASDIVGAGVVFGNLLGSLSVRDLLNGAAVTIGGAEELKTKITARDVADGTTIDSGSTISILTAVRVGDGTITAPVLGKLKITGDAKAGISGDFGSDVTLAHTAFLSPIGLKKNIFGGALIAGVTHDATLSLAGPAGAFKTGRMVNSAILLNAQIFNPSDPLANFGFTDTDPTHGKLASFTATGIKGSMLPAFDNSNIIAEVIGSASLASVDTANGGVQFGIVADVSIGSVTSKSPELKYDPKGAAAHTSGDFVVKLV